MRSAFGDREFFEGAAGGADSQFAAAGRAADSHQSGAVAALPFRCRIVGRLRRYYQSSVSNVSVFGVVYCVFVPVVVIFKIQCWQNLLLF